MSSRSIASSAFLHVVILLLAIFGLPSFLFSDELIYEPQVITVELLPIDQVANAPNRAPKPPKKEKKKPETVKPKQEKPKPKKEEKKKPDPKPEPEPVKKEEKPEPKPEKKPEPKKEEVKKEEVKKEKPKEKEPTLEEILAGIEKEAPKTPVKKEAEEESAEAEEGPKTKSDVPYDPSRPLSQTVKDSIRNQIMKCWNYQGGAKDQEELVAHIQVVFEKDGSIIQTNLKASEKLRYNSDHAFQALVDSAMRATRNADCVPLKGLPVDQYSSWSKVELVFNPDEMW